MSFNKIMLFCLLMLSLSGQAIELTFPQNESVKDTRSTYPVDVIKLIMAQINLDEQNIQLAPSLGEIHQGRALLELNKNNIDFVWSVSDSDREQLHYFLDFDIYFGQFGKRVLLTMPDKLVAFTQINKRCYLTKLTALVGKDWPEYKLFLTAGVPVSGTTEYESLFKMLIKGRADYIPRSIFEYQSELDTHPELALVPDYSIYYEAPVKIFYSPKVKQLLGKKLENALLELNKRGDIFDLFMQQNGAAIRKFNQNYKMDKRFYLEDLIGC